MGCKSFVKIIYKWTTDFLNENTEKSQIKVPEVEVLRKSYDLCMQIQIRINLMSMKTKKKTPIYVRQNNLVSKQFTCSKNITVSIKNDVHIMKLF